MKSIWIAIIYIVLVLLIGVCSTGPMGHSDRVGQVVTSGVISPVPMTSILSYCKSLGQRVATLEKSLLRFAYIGFYFNTQHFYVPLMVRWASWIWMPRRARRPYRNPLRAFRLNKKQRKRLRRRLSILLTTKQESFLPSGTLLPSSSQEWA